MEETKDEPYEKVVCPFCQTNQIQRISRFGKAQLVEQYRCNECQSVFERIKW